MKKRGKTFFTAILVAFLLSAFCGAATAEESAAVFGTTDFETVQSGVFTTTLYLEAGSNLTDFEFQLSYDSDIVNLVSAMQSVDLIGEALITPKESEGRIHISYTRTGNNITRKTDFVELTFLVDENAGPGHYEFLRLDEAYRTDAHTRRDNDLFPIPIRTDFSALDLYDFGDTDLNHSVSIADVTYLRQHLARIRTLTDYQLNRADALYDHVISIADAVRIQQHLADKSVSLGNRVNVTFMNTDDTVNTVKSVVFGKNLVSVPQISNTDSGYDGVWSYSKTVQNGVDFRNLEKDLTVYPVYRPYPSSAVKFYRERLTETLYSENTLNPGFTGFHLPEKMKWEDGYTADLYWSSDNNAILSATTGEYHQPAYNTSVRLTASIISYLDGSIEAQDKITFDYDVIGKYPVPLKDDIYPYLRGLFQDGGLDQNLRLPGKVTNADTGSAYEFEVRLDWLLRRASGEDEKITQLTRTNAAQTVTLIAVASFNGIPLEGDGRLYFDDLELNAVNISEVRNYLISQIAANTGLSVTNGEEFWHDDQKYHCKIRWISQNHDVAVVENNVVSIRNVISGTSLPLTVEATFASGSGDQLDTTTIKLAYTVSVETANAVLSPGTNIDEELWKALKAATGVSGTLTTDALKNVKFVYLDLSQYPGIRDLSAITYCRNLRVLNISGLQVDETSLNQICTLNKLEALIANHCGIETFTVGGVPVLDKMIHLKMLDLAYNRLQSLDSVLSKNNRYGKMEELYLNNNQLTDISALCEITSKTVRTYNSDGTVSSETEQDCVVNRAPMLRFLTLDNNHLNDEDLAAFSNFRVLKFLSLGNNEIHSVTPLKDNRTLLELHLQGNQIEDVRDLRFLIHLQSLFLGHNRLRNVYSGRSEGNISYLRYLSDLEILYLNDNEIEDISELDDLIHLKVLNINHNRIRSLSMLSNMGETMVELYAEDNDIDSFSFIRNLTGLTRLMLSHNRGVYESSLGGYLANLKELRTLTLSGKELRSLSFLEGMTKLVRLDVADCVLPSYCPTSITPGDGTLTVNSFTDNIASILARKDTLRFLDVSNNGLAYGPAGITKYLSHVGTSVSADSITFSGKAPEQFSRLYELTDLMVLYADNLDDDVDAGELFSVMTGVRYLSMENCGITDASWLSQMRGLVYVDLSGNRIQEFDLGNYISTRSRSTLESLYIDSQTETAFIDSFRTFDENVLRSFSAERVRVEKMDYLPDMKDLEYLNLSHSGITRLSGDNEDYDGWFNLSRYQSVRELDLTGVQADIQEVSSLPALKTLYTIGGPTETIFQKQNLLELYDLYHSGVHAHLYGYDVPYVPSTEKEGTLILGTLEDYGRVITVAADGLISDNNPVLPESVNGFPITWTLSNETNYEIRDQRIAVRDYTDIEDGTLILTASIQVYPDQGTVERSFRIWAKILRADLPYLSSEARGVSERMKRSESFVYDVKCVAAETEGFSTPAKPVYTDVRYQYSGWLADGSEVPYTTLVTETDGHHYQITDTASLKAVLRIRAEMGHTTQGEFIPDWELEKNIQIEERIFTLTLIGNGGTIISTVDGSRQGNAVIQAIEDDPLFEHLIIERDGHAHTGWYSNESLTEKYEGIVMPMHDLTLYAGWQIYTYTVQFETNSGTAIGSQWVNHGSLAQRPSPDPGKANHRFMGWYADPGLASPFDFNTPITRDTTIYAKWLLDEYKVTFHANGGSGGKTITVHYNDAISWPDGFSRTGYSMTGWYRNSNGTDPWNFGADRVTHDITLYSGWSPNNYTVHFDGNGGSASPGSKTVTYGTNYGSLASASRGGYSFAGWYSSRDGGTRIHDSTNVSTANDHTLYAHWDIIRVTIPNFSGWHVNDVKNWCNSNGIHYTESWEYDWSVPSDHIRSNSHSGSTVDWGTTIALYVSRGEKPIAVGDTVYVDATRYWNTSYGNPPYGDHGARTGRVLYMNSGASKPYNIDGTGWVSASAVHQRTN